MPEVIFGLSKKDYDVTIFVLEDPTLRVSKRYFGNQVILDVEYQFDTELLYAFSYETCIVDGHEERHYYAHYINGEEEKKEVVVDNDVANLRLSDGIFIYNGSYYRSIL